MFKSTYRIGNQIASINNKLVGEKFYYPTGWNLSVRWTNMLHGMHGIGGLPIGAPTASGGYSTHIFWEDNRIGWNSTGSAIYTGISANGSNPNSYYDLYHFGYYTDWPTTFAVEYSASDSAGNKHELPESIDFHWSGNPGYFYIQLEEAGRGDAYIMYPLSAFSNNPATSAYNVHVDLVYPTGW